MYKNMRLIPELNLYETIIEVDYCDYNYCTLLLEDITLNSNSDYCAIYHTKDFSSNKKDTLLNLFSYYLCKPCFFQIENIELNNRLQDLYLRFEITEMLSLRDPRFLQETFRHVFFQLNPIFLSDSDRNTVIGNIPFYEILELYNASLKQFEPFPRCVFLFRIFEFGAINHYQKIKRPPQYNVVDAINYYIDQIYTFDYIPVYIKDTGLEAHDMEDPIKVRQPSVFDLINRLKDESQLILNEWSVHKDLMKLSAGEIIYNLGRNSIAHGGRLSRSKYDYSYGYKLINEINIILELISRYIIETLNPDIKKAIETNINLYSSESSKYF